ncbi:MAG: glycosyltransferase family 87 protein [Paracoccaceae bacterium]
MANTRTPERDVALALTIPAAWCALMLWLRWNLPPPDILSLYYGARFFDAGRLAEVYAHDTLIFSGEVSRLWRETANSFGYAPDYPLFPYVYPPLWAALLGPVAAKLPPAAFSNLAYAVQLPLFCGAAALSWRLYRPGFALWRWMAVLLALATVSIVGLQAVWQNQPQIALAFLVVLAFERQAAGRPAQAGAALAAAAALKLYPALFALIWLTGGNRRALGWFAGTGAALGVASLALGGVDIHREFLAQVGRISEVVVASRFNFNLEATLFQMTHFSGHLARVASGGLSQLIFAEPGWITWTVRATLVAGMAAMLARARGADPAWRQRALTPAFIALVSICGPLGWGHHFLPVLMFLPGLLCLWGRRAGAAMLAGFALMTAGPALDALNLLPGPVMAGQLAGAAAMALALMAFLLSPVCRQPGEYEERGAKAGTT